MISQKCFTRQWCEDLAVKLRYNDTQLIEKVIRALSLLELLIDSGCPSILKEVRQRCCYSVMTPIASA